MTIFEISITEWIGYLATTIVLISFLMKNVTHLRIVNSIGCLVFVFYAFMLNPLSIPIIITNSVIFCINIYYILKK
ncbi:uroporphyrinogen decarboxylase [Siansivirga zeaxanthinifaciens CC-SAMT-1]|uniref:Uroporphyrinogen decarboxylase n=1 Tax=Siansivirga zeaxanthinifaciens CC-SAMT-1 TaxID=1454006 RepID=A0A0C5VT61_9FLAO|nr:uroporphyrinogen decarboxylase [Siansivirga zeaxanthinifaciens CC-SAMT-1]